MNLPKAPIGHPARSCLFRVAIHPPKQTDCQSIGAYNPRTPTGQHCYAMGAADLACHVRGGESCRGFVCHRRDSTALRKVGLSVRYRMRRPHEWGNSNSPDLSHDGFRRVQKSLANCCFT